MTCNGRRQPVDFLLPAAYTGKREKSRKHAIPRTSDVTIVSILSRGEAK
jgi:hypothetical protein